MADKVSEVWEVQQFGTPENALRMRTRECQAELTGDYYSVGIERVALSSRDARLCRGLSADQAMPPFVPGFGAVGKVMGGPQASVAHAGDRVVVAPVPFGCLTETALVHSSEMFSMPPGLPVECGARLVASYLPMWVALVRRGRVKANETILILGGPYDLVLAAIHIGVALGADVCVMVEESSLVSHFRSVGATVLVMNEGCGRFEYSASRDYVVIDLGLSAGAVQGVERSLSSVHVTRYITTEFSTDMFQVGVAVTRPEEILGFQFGPYRNDQPFIRSAYSKMVQLIGAGRMSQPEAEEHAEFGDVAEALQKIDSGLAGENICVVTAS